MPRRDSPTSVRRASALVVAAGLMLGCGGDSAEEQRERLAEDLVAETDGALDEEASRCVADALHEEFGDSFEQVLDAARDEDGGDVRTKVIDIFADCDALAPIIDDAS